MLLSSFGETVSDAYDFEVTVTRRLEPNWTLHIGLGWSSVDGNSPNDGYIVIIPKLSGLEIL